MDFNRKANRQGAKTPRKGNGNGGCRRAVMQDAPVARMEFSRETNRKRAERAKGQREFAVA
jgi:hypothetical protein